MAAKKMLTGAPLFIGLFIFFVLNAVLVTVIYFLWK